MAEEREPKASKNWLDRNMPTREQLSQNRFIRPIAHRVMRGELWRFTRNSVPRGVGLGLLAGFWIPMGLQTVVGAFFALPLRANVPLTVLFTFITNPFTYAFWIIAANWLGDIALLGFGSNEVAPTEVDDGFFSSVGWFFEQAAVTILGFFLLGIVFSTVGYFVSSWVWNGMVMRKRRRRSKAVASRR